jgi:hypothetical protein
MVIYVARLGWQGRYLLLPHRLYSQMEISPVWLFVPYTSCQPVPPLIVFEMNSKAIPGPLPTWLALNLELFHL